MLNIHIFSTGSEITAGKSVDTNSTWIANELTGLGFTISKFVILPDKPELIEEEIRFVMNKEGQNLIIMTGGLGATQDDYTLEIACKISNSKPVVLQKAYDKLEYIAEQRGKSFQDVFLMSKRQTTYPEKAIPLENEVGLAVGFYLQLNETTKLVAMPGVPKEMTRMFTDHFLPMLKKDYNKENLRILSRCIWGLSEAIFQETFIKSNKDLIENKIEWGVTAKSGYIKVSFKSEDLLDLKTIIDKIDRNYSNFIGNDVFLDIHQMLTASKRTVATVESCTGGLIGKLITDLPGSSLYYYGSIVSYDNSIKSNIVKVKKETLEEYGAVSKETAIEMAENVQKLFNTNYAISVTGIAGPGGATKDKKVGLVYIGIKGNHDPVQIYKYDLPLGREIFREYVSNIALFHLYKKLIADGLG
jgi:nicotinamide-nucleotide amidase